MAPIFTFAAARKLLTRASAAKHDAERSAVAESLSRMRYDPPTVSALSAIKWFLVFSLLQGGIWWYAQHRALRDFAARAEKVQAQVIAKDKAIQAALTDEVVRLRRTLAEIDDVQKEMDKTAAARIEKAQADLVAAKKSCGWAPDTVHAINGTAPAAIKQRRAPAKGPRR